VHGAQDTRWGEYLRRLLGIRGHSLDLGVLTDVMPVLELAGDRDEDAYLRGEKLFMAGASIGLVAGQYARMWLEIGPTTNVMAVIERVAIAAAAGTTARVSFLPALTIGTGGATVYPRDGRVQNQAGPYCQAFIGVANNAIATADVRSAIVPQGDDVLPPVVVTPGSRLVVEASPIATAIDVTLYWREVPIPPDNR